MEQLMPLGVKPLLSFQISKERGKKIKIKIKKKPEEIVTIEIETHSCILKFSDLTLRFWFWCRDLVLRNNRVTCLGRYSWEDEMLFRLSGTRLHHYSLHPFSNICSQIYALCVSLPTSVNLFGYFLKYRSSQVLRFFIQSLENQLVLIWKTWSWVAGFC